MKINRNFRISSDGYYKRKYKKESIVLHHTVGGSAESTFNWWEMDDSPVGTAFIIGRDGTIYEVFDPEHWAWHLGIKGVGGKFDKNTIGIELASVGPLLYNEGKFYFFNRMTPETEYKGEVFDVTDVVGEKEWRGWRFFAQYPESQLDSLSQLIRSLSREFEIPISYPDNPNSYFSPPPDTGIYAHSQVRKDKSDVHLGFDWELLDEIR